MSGIGWVLFKFKTFHNLEIRYNGGMLQKSFVPFFVGLNKFIHRPSRVFYVGLGVLVFSLAIDGTLWNMYRLNREIDLSQQRVELLSSETKEIEQKIKKSYQPEFIEKEARRRFELASEGDLVFVFPPSKDRVNLKQN